MSYQPSDETAIASAGRYIAVGCDAVKCEGGARVASRVRAMTDAGILVMGHLGLTPDNLAQLGGYRVQGKTAASAECLLTMRCHFRTPALSRSFFVAMPPETPASFAPRSRFPYTESAPAHRSTASS